MSSADTRPKSLARGNGPRIPRTFRALRHRNYQLWFFGQGLSLVGTWMQTMAQQVLVYRLTGSAMALGIVNLMAVIPLVPMSLFGGLLSDRMPKRTLLLFTQSAMLLQALLLGLLVWTDTVEVWHVYLLAFWLGAVKALDAPARQSFVVDMVESKEDLSNAIGLNSAIGNGARTLGPALAGLTVAVMGEAVAFFVNAGSFVAVISSLGLMRDLPQRRPRQLEGAGLFTGIAQGIRFVLKEQTLAVLLTLIAVSGFLSMPYSTLLPVFANRVLGESAAPLTGFLCGGETPIIHCEAPEALPLGMLLTALGLGAVTGALLVASLPERIRRGRALTLGNLGVALFLLLFAFSNSFALSMVIIVMVGMSQVFQNALANTLLQISSPDSLRGRVMSLYSLIHQGAQNLGGLQAGLCTDLTSAPLSIGVGAAVSLVYGLYVAVRYPRVRELP